MKTIQQKYSSEQRKIEELLGPELYEFFKDSGVILAGGAITSLFTNKEINDFDIYFQDLRTLVDAVAFCFGEEDYCRYDSLDGGISTIRFHNMTDKSMLLEANGQNIQFIHFDYFNSIGDIFNTFDFTCCMGAYDFKNEMFVMHEDFMKHNSQRYLKFNNGTAFPLVSLLRVDKYKQKGYEISKSEFIRIAMQCMQLELNNWEDIKSHIGGMYGYDMSDVFDENKDFNIAEVIDQLDNIDTKKIKKYIPMADLSFKEVIEKIDDGKDIPELPMKQREGCFYKTVSADMKSPIFKDKGLDYSVGNIVDGGQHGIYVSKDLHNLEYSYPIVVELEPVGYVQVIEDNNFIYKKRVIGKLKVTNSASYEEMEGGALMNKYLIK